MEGSHSGLVRRPGKSVCLYGHRGFESLTLRLSLAKARVKSKVLCFCEDSKDFSVYKFYRKFVEKYLAM